MNYVEIEREIDFYTKKYRRFDLTLTGGEFSIRRDSERILKLVDRKKKEKVIRQCYLQTNGRALSDPKKARRFAKTIDGFLVAIHGHNAAVHDKITTATGSFKETTKAIKNLIAAGSLVASQTVINKKNYKHLPSIFRFIVEELKICSGNITFPHPDGNANSVNVVPTFDEIRKKLNTAIRYLVKKDFGLYAEMIPICVIDKDLRSCAEDTIEERVVGTDSAVSHVRDIEYCDVMKKEYRKPLFCKRCIYNRRCVGVWRKYFEFYGGRGLKPVRPLKAKSAGNCRKSVL